MVNGRSVLLAFLLGLVLSGVACADMMPVSLSDTGPARVQHESTSAGFDQAGISNIASGVNCIIHLGLGIDGSLAGVMSDTEHSTESQDIQCLPGGVGSLPLCLYGLLSLGLCQCRPWIKSVSITILPEWYHDGGPQQIGHSYAFETGPNPLSTILCLLQPPPNADYGQLPYFCGTVAFQWRVSQFARDAIAPRGPPCMS